jgi:hypothetical protein
MRSMISTLTQVLRKTLFVLALVCSFSFLGWFGASTQPSYAANRPAVNQTQNSQSVEAREEAYEEAKEIADDPKRGVEKEAEKEIKQFRKENPDEGGLVEQAKDLVKTRGQSQRY